ncbi:hypothetical protein SAMN06265375_101675 [Muriicola jejuensis]|uniref:DUF6973 domain-containing protein n=1 Tax=Muriicola jejuensis TaxID=504488 RepID=A0A6P0UI12_9FLAO|nr:hypothetical protein [Muriicola jejuensis]NER09806.1 hypothetical protein [Muriicola jejuensis]SMP05602.1 hypothetical protein SAMN06265375_101675 [Muriicola jejuensis]
MKEIWGVIRRARPGQLLELLFLCLQNIRLIWPTYKATRITVEQANRHFGLSHRRNTPANAFRHALWNWLIACESSKKVKNEEKVLRWTQKITDMHEKILPGNALSNAMDLHNNEVGRQYFRNEKQREMEFGISLFLDLSKHSQLIQNQDELQKVPHTQFVHLIDKAS